MASSRDIVMPPGGVPTMKTVLLTLVALVVSAQPVEVYYNPPILPECYTGKWLNGVWWTRSNRMERWAYLSALREATGRKLRIADNVYQVTEQ